ncbi:MAG: sigma 54-interacting transcriptional regulator [Syntrophothermus sp.]|uniref:sigma-54 interaction domain-containing protein n=1 Tax=Syntrophothermus sp. TaxID=2736299 RepID=UPI00257C7E2D|nr:sigma 54-interacting transcriptional regulator [Syntrophothermus sp.]NSW82938.1 sigma 54-interacting transcriptional regulator [Syntrophothermus sp.]
MYAEQLLNQSGYVLEAMEGKADLSDADNITKEDLVNILMRSYDAILITDSHGTVVLVNQATADCLGVQVEELIGQNVNDLVKSGLYSPSPTMEAIKTRSVVTALLKARNGNLLVATSVPVLDAQGEVQWVVTNTRFKSLVDNYIEALELEKAKSDRYKMVLEYLSSAVAGDTKSIVAQSPKMRQVLNICDSVARTDSTVLIVGETGSGKEVLARYIHRISARAQEPFIPVNCAAIPHELMESEFFGYAPGAFTGASNTGKPGLFEMADKGTLFLDEIGELPLSMQSKLLRVLETQEVQRVGGTSLQKVDVRLIAATNRDLKSMVEQKVFRSDLYYRLNVIPLHIPPLRERPEDIIVLANKYLEELNRKYGFNKKLSLQAIQEFLKYNWPGNVRELRNVVERMAVTSVSDLLGIEGVQFAPKANVDESEEVGRVSSLLKSPTRLPSTHSGTLKSVLEAVEQEYIKQVLEECGGRIGMAAKRLGIHRTVLYRKMRAKEINKGKK